MPKAGGGFEHLWLWVLAPAYGASIARGAIPARRRRTRLTCLLCDWRAGRPPGHPAHENGHQWISVAYTAALGLKIGAVRRQNVEWLGLVSDRFLGFQGLALDWLTCTGRPALG